MDNCVKTIVTITINNFELYTMNEYNILVVNIDFCMHNNQGVVVNVIS